MGGLGDGRVLDVEGVVGSEKVDGLEFAHIFCNE
jgi:hypothetical protein